MKKNLLYCPLGGILASFGIASASTGALWIWNCDVSTPLIARAPSLLYIVIGGVLISLAAMLFKK